MDLSIALITEIWPRISTEEEYNQLRQMPYTIDTYSDSDTNIEDLPVAEVYINQLDTEQVATITNVIMKESNSQENIQQIIISQSDTGEEDRRSQN